MKRKIVRKYAWPLYPKIQTKLDKIIQDSNKCWTKHAGDPKYQVSCAYQTS